MHNPLPLTRDVVLIGGGHTHALVLRHWGMKRLGGARLTLINPHPTAPYTGMLPGYVAGLYARKMLEIDLVRLARFAGARLILAKAKGFDRTARRIQVEGQADVSYDVLSIDIGVTSGLPSLPGFATYAHGAKPLGDFAVAWERYLDHVLPGSQQANVTVIGGGVAGVELALAMMHRLRTIGAKRPKVTVLDIAPKALVGIGDAARQSLFRHMKRLGVTLITGVGVVEIRPHSVVLSSGVEITSAFCVGAAGAQPHAWLSDTGLALSDGFIQVDKTLRSLTDPAIYASGDCAYLTHAPRPKAGVFAVRQAPTLYHNLRAELTGRKKREYRPQNNYLKLISTGGKGAVADKYGLRLGGRWLWLWKDRIDRKFMKKFDSFPAMKTPDLPAERTTDLHATLGAAPLCGGCGAKVGGADLTSVLSALPTPIRVDVLSLLGDDAAILRHGDGQQVMTTDHLRAFLPDPYRMTRIAAVHSLGDIWAMGARPQAALATVILPRMTPKMQAETLREIMLAATRTFRAAGAEIVGGHTSMGSELTIGFSVTGLLAGSAIRNSGAQVGDVLILTKPIGSGTILAAEMQMKAQGDWVAACYDMMQHASDKAAALLAPVANAMTDVTGFGLAGHCSAMMADSSACARLTLAAIPLLSGAEILADSGIRSSIWQANRASVGPMELPDTARAALLFDPQTAGGLLAAIPASKANACLEALIAAGETATIIGDVVADQASLSII